MALVQPYAPYGMPNMGNTCYISSVLQVLKAIRSFRAKCPRDGEIGTIMHDSVFSPQVVQRAYLWCRNLLNVKGASQEDAAELLLKIFDDDINTSVDTSCFENVCTKRKRCLTCNHVVETQIKEKILIITSLPTGDSPIQRSVDETFGYVGKKDTALPTGLPTGLPTPEQSPLSPGAPPASYGGYGRGFSGSSGAAQIPPASPKSLPGDVWYCLDDGSVTVGPLSRLCPYIMFYEERPASSVTDNVSSVVADDKVQVLDLDCDDGKCKSRQPHESYVSSYEIGSVLVLHVAVPTLVDMSSVERTLVAGCGGFGQRCYDLTSFISRVGSSHFVAYVKQIK